MQLLITKEDRTDSNFKGNLSDPAKQAPGSNPLFTSLSQITHGITDTQHGFVVLLTIKVRSLQN